MLCQSVTVRTLDQKVAEMTPSRSTSHNDLGKLLTHKSTVFYCYTNVCYRSTVSSVFLTNREMTKMKFSSSATYNSDTTKHIIQDSHCDIQIFIHPEVKISKAG